MTSLRESETFADKPFFFCTTIPEEFFLIRLSDGEQAVQQLHERPQPRLHHREDVHGAAAVPDEQMSAVD